MIAIFILFGKINAFELLCSDLGNKTGTACMDRNCFSILDYHTKYCEECKEGYKQNIDSWCVLPEDFDCFDLVENCDKCDLENKTKCSICSQDYYLTLDNRCLIRPDCSLVIEHCLNCKYPLFTEPFICTQCETDYEIDYNGHCVPKATSDCFDIVKNCNSCNKEDKLLCAECKEGFLYNYIANKCVTEEEIDCFFNNFFDPNCKHCDEFNKTKCGSCGNNNQILAPADNGTCVGVGQLKCEDIMANCEKCDSKYCRKCKPNYVEVIRKSDPDKVLKCLHVDEAVCTEFINDCIECDAKNKTLCAKCDTYYKLSEDKMSCQKVECDLSCCNDCDVDQNCYSTQLGSRVVDNQCIHTYDLCEDREFCNECDENNIYCFNCENGYILKNNTCVRYECADNKKDRCFSCFGLDNDMCSSCYPGYLLNSRYDDCMKIKCPRQGNKRNKCDFCDDYGRCLSCKKGYEIVNDNCYIITKCPESKIDKCEICDELGDCVTCFPGYLYNESTYDCDKIDCPEDKEKRCKGCDLDGKCVTCHQNYELDYGDCFLNICPSDMTNCIRCNRWGDCLECEKDYIIIDNVCEYHPSNGCLEFDSNGQNCIQCDEDMGFVLNDENTCTKLPDPVGPEIDEKIDITESSNVILDKDTKTIEIKTNIGELDTSKSYLVDIKNDISIVKIDNTNYKIGLNLNSISDVNICPADGVDEPTFDIILPNDGYTNVNIKLPKCNASIFGQGILNIKSDEQSIDIQSIVVDGTSKSTSLEVDQYVPIHYNEINLYGKTKISFYKSAASADNVNIEKSAEATIGLNINMNKLKIGEFAKVIFQRNTNLEETSINIDYDDSQKVQVIPLTMGDINSVPKSLKLNRMNNNNRILSEKSFKVASFNNHHDCSLWANFINNNDEKPDPYYKNAECTSTRSSIGYQLILQNESPGGSPNDPNKGNGDGKNKDGLKPGAIAAIVIACIVVVAAVILILYFFVFRKRNEQQSSAEDAQNEEV